MKIIISGAGIGGLTAALCLLKQGHDVHLFEKSSILKEVGAGLQLAANAMHVMRWLGLQEKIEARAVRPESIDVRHFLDGRSLFKSPLGETHEQNYGAPYLHIHRADLQSILVESVKQHSSARLSLGCAVQDFKQDDSGVDVVLSNGDVVKGDCLIGADGIKSTIRQHLLKDSANSKFIEPRRTKYVAWRGVVKKADLPKDFMDTVVSNFVGPRKHMVIYYLRNKELVNFVGVVEKERKSDDKQQSDQWAFKASKEKLKQDFAGWHSTVQLAIDALDPEQCYQWNLCDHYPIKEWVEERVALLGDSAHAALPFMASGASMAIEDARVLSQMLGDMDCVAASLKRYQQTRMKRTEKVQKRSRQLGHLYHLPFPWASKLAFSLISKPTADPNKWLYSYNSNEM